MFFLGGGGLFCFVFLCSIMTTSSTHPDMIAEGEPLLILFMHLVFMTVV